MLGAAFGYLTLQVSSFIKRQATLIGLMAGAGLIAIFAAGYGLDALRAWLALRIGGVYASLAIAGGLLLLALLCIVAAVILKRSARAPSVPRETTAAAPAVSAARLGIGAPAVLAGGAITGLIAGVPSGATDLAGPASPVGPAAHDDLAASLRRLADKAAPDTARPARPWSWRNLTWKAWR